MRVFVPHVDQQPHVLVATDRTKAEQHDEADFEIRPLRASSPPQEAYLPVAGLPTYPGEVRLLLRAKMRPALVVAGPGVEVEKALRTTDYCLTQDALGIMDEWLTWFLQGGLPDQGVLAMLREELAKL